MYNQILYLHASRHRSTGTDSANQDVNAAVSLIPDLWSGCLAVNLRVIGIRELIENECLGAEFRHYLLSLYQILIRSNKINAKWAVK